MRREFEMTQAQLDTLLEACKSVPLIAIHCGMPSSPQENANRAWRALGQEMGFDYLSVEPTGRGDRFFTALPTPVTETVTLTSEDVGTMPPDLM